MSPIILAQDLGKTYRSGKLQVPPLPKVNFSIPGSLPHATSGSVPLDGVDFAKLTDGERTRMRRAKIGFVFQRFNLLPTLSAMGNIEIAHDIANLGAAQKQQIDQPLLNHLTRMLGIDGRLDHRPNELPGGDPPRVP